MCGIIGGFTDNIEPGLQALLHRGPDAQAWVRIGKLSLGHTRLAILDIDPRSNQPFEYNGVTVVYNGELWNYRELKADLQGQGFIFNTSGDTEVVAAALSLWGVKALPKFNGMFAMAWTVNGEMIYLARDRFGEIPLHVAKQRPFLFSSELKALLALKAHQKSFDHVPPGHYLEVSPTSLECHRYYDIPIRPIAADRNEASQKVFELIGNGSTERTISDVPVCTLLSGGIDSAGVAYFLKQSIPDLVAYTAVYNPKSRDLKAARLVAEMLNIELVEVTVPAPSPDDLSQVIKCIEMPYKAQVEIGWACLKLAEAMRVDGFKVTFSGEGSDELWASYGFAYHALKTQDWHEYRKKLFLSQSRKNFARCNKIFMRHSIECRLPFLHPPLVEYAISLMPEAVQDGKSKPKAVIQNAFSGKLPDEIARRPKVAFQDGMGIKTAIRKILPSPRRFYNAEYSHTFA